MNLSPYHILMKTWAEVGIIAYRVTFFELLIIYKEYSSDDCILNERAFFFYQMTFNPHMGTLYITPRYLFEDELLF